MSGKVEKRNLSPREKRFFYLCLFTGALFFGSIHPQTALARTWYIKADGTGDAPTIQAGVDSATAGDTVLVGAGTYADTTRIDVDPWSVVVNVYIDKPVVLMGQLSPPGVTIDGATSDVVVAILDVAATVTVGSLRMTRPPRTDTCVLEPVANISATIADFDIGIWCVRARFEATRCEFEGIEDAVLIQDSEGTISSCKFQETYTGVFCDGSGALDVTSNTFVKCVYPIGCSSSSVIIEHNNIEGVEYSRTCTGVSVTNCEARISDNWIRTAKTGGVNCYGGRLSISSNTIEDVLVGVYLSGTDSAHVEGNVIYAAGTGIEDLAGALTVVKSNTIDSVGVGVYCHEEAATVIRNNIVVRGGIGVFCDIGASPTIECNDVFDVQNPYLNCGDHTGLNGNFSLDPEFCGIDDSGNYFLQSDSPCAAGNHPDGYDCDLIGALPVNCGKVPAKQHTWGSVKNLYRKKEER
jgi:hypothetical protein